MQIPFTGRKKGHKNNFTSPHGQAQSVCVCVCPLNGAQRRS